VKRVLIITVAVALALTASFAFGWLGQVLNSFPAPASYPLALAVANNYGAYLWVYCNSGRYRIYRVSGINGSVYSSFISPQGSYTRGLTYSCGGGVGLPTGNYLWMGNWSNDNIYRCRISDGYPYTFFPARHDMMGGLAAMAIADGGRRPNFMASSDNSPFWIYRQSLTNGSIYSSFAPSGPCYDLAWDWRNMLIWTSNYHNIVYGFLTTGSLRASFRIPVSYPAGFCYTTQYLWVSTTGNHYIYRIHCPYPVSVEPASIGRIKASFR
jgi:hypothetical protein